MDFKTLFRPGILGTRPYTPGKPISEVQRELGLDKVVKLASNENPEGPLPSVIEAVKDALAEINRYPDASCYKLTHALSEDLGVDPGSIIFGNGSNEILDLFIRALVSPGETFIYPTPSFIVYPLTSAVHFETGRPVPLRDDDCHDLKAMAAAVDETTKLVIVCNPNNPTGTYNTADEFTEFMSSIPESVIVIVDEAYYEYVDAADYPQTLKMQARFPNLVLARTFSKIHSMAGLRIGYAVGHPDLIGEIHKTREPFNVNMLSQAAAIAVLKEKDETAARCRRNRENLIKFSAELTSLGLAVTPSQTNFILVRYDGDATELTSQLLKHGVIVRPMTAFGMAKDTLRISVGLPEENAECIRALKEILNCQETP